MEAAEKMSLKKASEKQKPEDRLLISERQQVMHTTLPFDSLKEKVKNSWFQSCTSRAI